MRDKKKISICILICIIFIQSLIQVSILSKNVTAAENDSVYERIKKTHKIKIGTASGYVPYEYISEQTGELVGFDIKIAKKVVKSLEKEMNIDHIEIEWVDMSFDALLAELETGSVDMVIAGMTPTEERKKTVDFSNIYFQAEIGILVREEDVSKYKTLKDFDNIVIGAQTGTIQEEIAKNEIKASEVKTLEDVSLLIQELSALQVDGVVIEKPVGKAYSEVYDGLVLAPVDVGSSIKGEGTAIAFPKGSSTMVNLVNSSIQNDLGDVNELFQKEQLKAFDDTQNTKKLTLIEKIQHIFDYSDLILKGILMTLILSLLTIVFGSVGGIVVALMRRIHIFGKIFDTYVAFIRGTPLLVQLFIFAYGFPRPPSFGFGSWFSLFLVGLLTLSLNSSAYIAELIRAGINNVSKGQVEAARSLGVSSSYTMRHIVLPQAIKSILPGIGNEFIVIVKESSIVSVVGLLELTRAAKQISAATFEPFIPYMMIAVVYFIITYSLSKCLLFIEGRLAKHD